MERTLDQIKVALATSFLQSEHKDKQGKPTIEAAVNTIKELADKEVFQVADYAKILFQENNIDVTDARLKRVYENTTVELGKKEKSKTKETALTASKKATEKIENFDPNDPNSKISDISDIYNNLTKDISIAVSATIKKYSYDQFISDCKNFDDAKNFKPKLFGGDIVFPEGSLSYIGARTGRGKTNSLVNLASEVISEQANNRKVVFLTFEMSCKQILNKLILSTAYRNADNDNTNSNQTKLDEITNPAKELYQILGDNQYTGCDYKKGKNFKEEYNVFREKTKSATIKIIELMDKGMIVLIDGRQLSQKEIIDFIKAESSNGTIVLVDYIQKLPGNPKSRDAYQRIQSASYDLQKTAGQTNSIIISAAQFNRISGNGSKNSKDKDVFSEESFRECGDIEQDAHNAIGIGWEEDKETRFYEVLKTREGGQQGQKYEINFNGKYSYMEQGERKEKKKKRPAYLVDGEPEPI